MTWRAPDPCFLCFLPFKISSFPSVQIEFGLCFSSTCFRLKFLDLFRSPCFGKSPVKLLSSLPAKSLEIGNLRAGHWLLPGDPLLGRFFWIRISISLHVCKFAARSPVGLTRFEVDFVLLCAPQSSSSPVPKIVLVIVLVLEF